MMRLQPSRNNMGIDHILYLSSYGGQRTWICQITECDGMKRVWRAECECPSPTKDDASKQIVIDEAFRQFHASTREEM